MTDDEIAKIGVLSSLSKQQMDNCRKVLKYIQKNEFKEAEQYLDAFFNLSLGMSNK